MINGFEIKCEKCGNIAIDVKGTAINYGASVRVKFTCLSCGYEIEVSVTQQRFLDFEEGLKENETLGDLIKANLKYTKEGKKYKKIGRYEKIAKGAMQSWDGQNLQPIRSPNTIGDIPAHFAIERDFYNLI